MSLAKVQRGLAAVLIAVLFTRGIDVLVDDFLFHEGEQVAQARDGGPTPAQAPVGQGTASLPDLLAQADVAAGKASARKCQTCHTFEPGGPNRVGPNLANVVGAAKASKPDFAYSDPLKSKGGTWTYEDLAAFLAKPSGFVPGTRMAFAGLSDAKERANVIAYLRSVTENPPPLPR